MNVNATATTIAQFGVNLARCEFRRSENVAVSPFGLGTTFGMLATGSSNGTLAEIELEVFGGIQEPVILGNLGPIGRGLLLPFSLPGFQASNRLVGLDQVPYDIGFLQRVASLGRPLATVDFEGDDTEVSNEVDQLVRQDTTGQVISIVQRPEVYGNTVRMLAFSALHFQGTLLHGALRSFRGMFSTGENTRFCEFRGPYGYFENGIAKTIVMENVGGPVGASTLFLLPKISLGRFLLRLSGGRVSPLERFRERTVVQHDVLIRIPHYQVTSDIDVVGSTLDEDRVPFSVFDPDRASMERVTSAAMQYSVDSFRHKSFIWFDGRGGPHPIPPAGAPEKLFIASSPFIAAIFYGEYLVALAVVSAPLDI